MLDNRPVVLVVADRHVNFDRLLAHDAEACGGALAREFEFAYLDCYQAVEGWYRDNRGRFVSLLVIDIDFSGAPDPNRLIGPGAIHHPVPRGFDPLLFQGFLIHADIRDNGLDRTVPVLFVAGQRQMASAQRFVEFIISPGQGGCAFVEATPDGRFDCPAVVERLDALALRPLDENARQEWRERHGMVIGRSRAMVALAREISLTGRSDATVLLLGSPGVGKELVANAIHRSSRRHDPGLRPLPKTVNIGALGGDLLEDELFGHIRGAFTGAVADRKGIFEAGEKSTVFLDEVGDIGNETQVKLLRCLENRTIKRLGSPNEARVDIRVIAATNRSISYLQSHLRPDFYTRLVHQCVLVPSLADRFADESPEVLAADMAEFTEFVVDRLNGNPMHQRSLGVDTGTVNLLAQLVTDHMTGVNEQFDGNIRTLLNLLERSYECAQYDGSSAVAVGHVITTMGGIRFAGTPRTGPPPTTIEGLVGTLNLARVERLVIAEAIKKCGNNQSMAADMLGVHRDTLRRKLATHSSGEQHNSA